MKTTMTDEGRKTVKRYPMRIKEVNAEVERMGIKILAQYVALSEFDFLNIIEAPDAETIANVSMELSARGTLHTSTLAALTLDDFIDSLSK